MKTISLLGSTGSIGTQTCEVCRKYGIRIKALAALKNTQLLARQAVEFGADTVCIYDESRYAELKSLLSGKNISILTGGDGLNEIAALDGVDLMVNSVVGMVGLVPTLTAIEKGTDIALANKETLVAGGELVMSLAAKRGVKIYPVDSEHSAIFQCLQGNKRSQLKSIILTASGGPFFGKSRKELENVTAAEALCHPNWSMGSKITVDSSTLMNKGLEFIEARWLFDLSPEQIQIVVHRESVIHSAVEYEDNSVIAQMGVPDMKIPIQYALLYPERTECDVKRLSLTDYGTLSFAKPDYETFECLQTCIDASKAGGTACAAVNGANEAAVGLFLEGKIPFLKIGSLVRGAFEALPHSEINGVGDILAADKAAREYVRSNVLSEE